MEYLPQRPVVYQSAQSDTAIYQARRFNGEIHKPWRIGSFSLLSRGHVSEQPDYDAELVTVDTEMVIQRSSKDRFGFERGRQAGNFLHKCLENIERIITKIKIFQQKLFFSEKVVVSHKS